MISNLKFGMLTNEEKELLLDSAYEVLEDVGADIHYDKAVQLLVQNGCTVENGIRVKFPRDVVKKALSTIPSKIQFYHRDGGQAMCLTGRNVYFGAGPTCCNFYDPFTGEHRTPQKNDAGYAAKVVDALPNMDFAMSLCMIGDQTAVLADIHEMDAMLRNTTKPISTWAFSAKNLDSMIQMAAAVAGGMDKLVEKPNIVIYNEPTTPFVHTTEALEKLFLTSEYAIPSIYSPGMMVSAAAPVTVAGALVVGLADSFVGLVLSQMIRPGCPIVAGIGAAVMDMMTMQATYGDPSDALIHVGAVEIFQYLNLPTFDLAGCTDSKCVDAQAGIEGTMRIMTTMMSGGNMVHDCGFMDMGMTGSLSMLCLTDEIVGMCRRLCRGGEVSKASIGLEDIKEAGPGGSFLDSEHTFEFFRTDLYQPKLLERRDYAAWKADGALTMGDRADLRVKEILTSHQVAPLPAEVLATMDSIVATAEAENTL